MRDRFLAPALTHGASPETADRWWRELEAHYSEPHRHYHTLRHIEEMLDLLPHADETVLMAVWFHDAIYGGKQNEERSAELARTALAELRFPSSETVEQLILATKTHEPSQVAPRFHAFLDADLAILGSAPARYDEYAAQIRREYAHIPSILFRSGRASVLRAFLQRPAIYATEEFRARFEKQARENMQREL
ncbi:MAG TPA: metal-dependent phosphohydrolase [Thermoanaerobaculia bacterium]|nr:metal-dependent phosphohydrolase [Thermoanaerobaculia bacterium]